MKKKAKFTKMVGVFSTAALLFTQVFTVGNAIGLETKDLKAQESINQRVLQKITAQGEEAELHIDLDLVYSEENYQNDYAPNTVLVGLRRPSGRRAAAAANMFEGVNVASAESLMTFADENEGITPFSANGADVDTEPSKGAFVEEQTGVYEIVKLNLAGQDVLDAIEILKENPQVVYAEPDYFYTSSAVPNDPYFGLQWDMNKIQAPEAWGIATGSADVVVGVVDTGIDYDHIDLADNIWTNPGEIPGNGIDDDGNGYIDDVHGWDFFHDDCDPDDYTVGDHSGHGTHVAGTIGAATNNGIGVAGINWNVKLAALKYYDEDIQTGKGSTTVRAVDYAIKEDIPILNNSYGGNVYNTSMYLAIARYNGLFVAGAGNDALNNDIKSFYPAGYDLPNIIAVASTDEKDELTDFSNYGEATVDIGAPGIRIYSTVPNDKYDYKRGTSMATPHVTGAAALLKSYRPELETRDLKKIILKSGDDVPALAGKTVTGKRLNLYKMLQMAEDYVPTEEITDISAGVPLQESIKGDDYKIYRFTPRNSGKHVFRTYSKMDTIGKLYMEDGTLVASNDDGNYEDIRNYNPTDFYFEYDVSNRLTYYLVVSTWDEHTGEFEVRINQTDDYGNSFEDAYEIPLDINIPVHSDTNFDIDTDYFKFNIPTAGYYGVFGFCEGSNIQIAVYDEDQEPVLQRLPDSEIVEFLYFEPGLYYMSTYDYYGTIGDYTIRVSPVSSRYKTLAADNFTTLAPTMMNYYNLGLGFSGNWSKSVADETSFAPCSACVKDGKATTVQSVDLNNSFGVKSIEMYRPFATPLYFNKNGEYTVTFKMTTLPLSGNPYQYVDFGGQFQVGWRQNGGQIRPYTTFGSQAAEVPRVLEGNEEYTFVVKVEAQQSGNDTLKMKVYSSSETPNYMPETWDYVTSYNRSGQADYVGVYFENNSTAEAYPTFDDLYVLKKN